MDLYIEPTMTPGEWMVTEQTSEVANIVFSGTGIECVEYCRIDRDAASIGPRWYRTR